MKRPLACAAALLVFQCLPHAAELPESSALGRAFVSLPYSELRALWEAGQIKPEPAKKPEPAPVAYLVNRAECVLALGEQRSALKAQFEVESLNGLWQAIPLLGGADVRLEKAEAGTRAILWEDGYRLLVNEPGKNSVALELSVPGLQALTASSAAGLPLEFGAATVKVLRVTGIPAGVEARVDGQAAAESRAGEAVFFLSSAAGGVRLQLSAPQAEKPVLKSSIWEVHSQVLVKYEEGRLHCQSHVFARTEAGSGTELFLSLPANASALKVTGEDLTDFSLVRGADERRLLRVRWNTAEILDRELTIAYATPQSPLAEEWQLQAPATPEAALSRTLFAIVPAEGLELQSDLLHGAVAPHRLPQWMRKEIDGAPFSTAETGAQLTLKTHWLPEVATAEAVIGDSKSTLRMVADGSMQAESTFLIRHQGPLAWRLELPADIQILSCTLNGQQARPLQREPALIEFNLPAPAPAAAANTNTRTGSTLVLTYAAKNPPLDPVSGRVTLELPRTELFIEHLEWRVAIPAIFEVTALEGNVVAMPTSGRAESATEEIVQLSKDLCRGERPHVELFYQRRTTEK